MSNRNFLIRQFSFCVFILLVKQRHALNYTILTVEQTKLRQYQDQGYSHEITILLAILLETVYHQLLRIHPAHLLYYLVEPHASAGGMYIRAAGGKGHILQQLFIKTAYHYLAVAVTQHLAIYAHRRTLGRSYTHRMYYYASVGHLASHVQCAGIVILTVGDHYHHPAAIALRRERASGHTESLAYGRTLRRHHTWRQVRHEILGRHIVTGHGKLHESVSRKHHQPYTVFGKSVNQFIYSHLGTLQTRRLEILRQHTVGNIHRQYYLHPLSLDLAQTRSHLRTGKSEDEHRNGGSHETILGENLIRSGLLYKITKLAAVAEQRQPTAIIAPHPKV